MRNTFDRFNGRHQDYQAARPSYAQEFLDWLGRAGTRRRSAIRRRTSDSALASSPPSCWQVGFRASAAGAESGYAGAAGRRFWAAIPGSPPSNGIGYVKLCHRGINWGDEAKGRMVDLVTADYDVVVRYQGGGNAGHTVVNEFGKFALHLLPSGIFRKGVVNILGNGVALDCESLWTEMSDVVMDQGVAITPENLKISDRASLLLPWHRPGLPGGGPPGGQEVRLHQAGHRPVLFGQVPEEDHHGPSELLYPEKALGPSGGHSGWKNLTLERVYGAKPHHHG